MKIAIISAMEKERQLILPLIENITTEKISNQEVYCGTLYKHQIIVAKCGIGKVNAAINTYRIITTFKPDLILNTGVAGGLTDRTQIGDLLIADYVAYHDVWCGPGTEIGVADGMEVFMQCNPEIIELAHSLFDGKRLQVGLICSGDQFISKKEEVIEITKNFPEAIAVDMESAAIAQTCILEQIPFNIIRVISDTPGSGNNIAEYENFWTTAPEKTFETIKELLSHI